MIYDHIKFGLSFKSLLKTFYNFLSNKTFNNFFNLEIKNKSFNLKLNFPNID